MSDDEKLSVLEQLLEQRKSLIDEAAAESEKRNEECAEFEGNKEPSDEVRSAFDGAEDAFNEAHTARMKAIKSLDLRIDREELIERRKQEAARASRGNYKVVSEPLTYRKDNAKDISYLKDLAAAQVPAIRANLKDGGEGAMERLERHAAELRVELPKRAQARERRAEAEVDRAEREFRGGLAGVRGGGLSATPFERRTDPNRTDGQGGYFVPPLWLVDEYIPYLRSGRTAANLCRSVPLPPGTDSINIPRVKTSTVVEPQTADLEAVASQDIEDEAVTAGVKTMAGEEDVAIQLIEQSPGQIFDRVVMEDLLADYNKKIDIQVISGTNANGQVAGIYPSTNWAGTNTVTYTEAAPGMAASFNQVLGAMASQVSYNRFNLEDFHFLLHPRRWFWFATGLDGAEGKSGRPIVSAEGFGPFNAAALENGSIPEGLVGRVPFGPQVYIDANVPTNNTSTYDVGIAAKWDDCWLFEGDLRTRVLPEVLSGTLEIRYQVYNYFAFLVRYGQSLAIATGTGFGAPEGALATSVKF